MINILLGSVVTQTVLGGLTKFPPVANFLQCTCAKNYVKKNWLRVNKVIVIVFFSQSCGRLDWNSLPCNVVQFFLVSLIPASTGRLHVM